MSKETWKKEPLSDNDETWLLLIYSQHYCKEIIFDNRELCDIAYKDMINNSEIFPFKLVVSKIRIA